MCCVRTERFFAFIALVFLVGGCAKKTTQAALDPSVPVLAARAERKTVPVELRAIGTGEAYSTVSIKAQVSAKLVAVHFREGQDVKKGDLLFTLDKRPFAAALAQAEANLARDRARAENSEIQARRYAKLYADGVASKEQNDQTQSAADSDKAAVKADEAAVEAAKLQLQYCTIYSPINGRTGTLMVHVGNLVKENDVPILIVINQITPIYVDFSVPEQYLAEVKRYMASGRLPVEVYPPDGKPEGELGYLSFVDNSVDSATGTIKLKGTFPNSARRLWPGQFDNVVLRLAEQAGAVVIPSQAVQTGQSGDFVFVVKSDNTVEQRSIVVERTQGSEAVIRKGIEDGEVVVTDGQLRLLPGSKVQVKSSSPGT